MDDLLDGAVLQRLADELVGLQNHVADLPRLTAADACAALECMARTAEHFVFLCRALKTLAEIRREYDH